MSVETARSLHPRGAVSSARRTLSCVPCFPRPDPRSQTIRITNNLGTHVEASIRTGSPDRYTVTPSQLRIKPGESVDVEIKLRLLRFANKSKAITQASRTLPGRTCGCVELGRW